MRTTRLPSVTMPPDVSTVVVGGFPQLNKFEQFTSDCHQMLLAGGPMCHVRMAGGSHVWRMGLGGGLGWLGGPCAASSNASWSHGNPLFPLDRQTRMKILPSRNFVGGR